MHGAPVSSPSASPRSPRIEPAGQVPPTVARCTSSGRLPARLEPSQIRRYLPTTSCGGGFDFYTHIPANLQDQSQRSEPNPYPLFKMSKGFLVELSLRPGNIFSIHDELEREGDSTVTFWEYLQRQKVATGQKSALGCLQSYFQDYPQKLERLRKAPVLVPWGGYFSQHNSPWLSGVITQLFMLLKQDDDGFIALIRDLFPPAGQQRELESELKEWQAQKEKISGRGQRFRPPGWVQSQLQKLFPDDPKKGICESQSPSNMLSYWQLGRILSLVIAPPLTRKSVVSQLVRGQADPDHFSTSDLMDAFLTDSRELLARSWTLYSSDCSARTDLVALKGSLHYLCLQQVGKSTRKWSHSLSRTGFDEASLVNAINCRIGSIDDVLDCMAHYQQHACRQWCVDPDNSQDLEVTAVSLTQLGEYISHLRRPKQPFLSGVDCAPMAAPSATIADKRLNSADPARGVFYIATGDAVLEKGVEELVRESPVTARELCNIGRSADISTATELDRYIQYAANCMRFRPMYLGMKAIEFTASFSRSETHASLVTAISQTCGYDLMHPLLTITPVPFYQVTDAVNLNDFELSDVPGQNIFWLPVKRSFQFLSDRGVKAIAQWPGEHPARTSLLD